MSSNRHNNKPADESGIVAKPGWWKIPGLGSSIIRQFEMILKEAPKIAKHWRPLLDDVQKHIEFINSEMEKISGQDAKDAAWKNFYDKTQSVMKKLKPLLEELDKDTPHTTMLLSQIENIFKQIPSLMMQFDKLKLHESVQKVLKYTLTIQNNGIGIIEKELQQRIPYFDTFRLQVEKEYKKIKDRNNKEKFEKLSPLEKITALAGMGEFNQMLEWVYLTLSRAGLELDIPEGYLLARRLFADNTLSIRDFYEKFTEFYLAALADAGFPTPEAQDIYPYLEKIILMQNDVLATHERADSFMASVAQRKEISRDAILLNLEMEILNRRNDEKHRPEDPVLETLLLNLKKNFYDEVLAAGSVKAIVASTLDSLSANETALISKEPVIAETIETALDCENETIKLKQQFDKKTLAIKARVSASTAKRLKTGDEARSAPASLQKVKHPNIKRVATLALDIYEQAKQANEIFSQRIKSEASSVGAINKVLPYLYGQLKVMLDGNIYNQYIKYPKPLSATNKVEFTGEGWVAEVGSTLAKIAELVDQFNQLSLYFSNKKIHEINSELNTPKEHLIVFSEKVRDFSIIIKELAFCYVQLQKDPVISTLLTAGGYQKLFLSVPAEKSTKKETLAKLPDLGTLSTLEGVFAAASEFYENSANKHFHNRAKIKENLQAFGRLQVMINKYNDFKQADDNVLRTENIRVFGFVLRNFFGLRQFFQDIPNAFSTLYSVSKKEFLHRAMDWNDALRELLLLFNRIEIELQLKPGYFTLLPLDKLLSDDFQKLLKIDKLPESVRQTSLHDVIIKSYNALGKLGYAIDKHESYPFASAIKAQQIEILHKTPANTIKRSYLIHLFGLGRSNNKKNNKITQAAALTKRKNLAVTLNKLITEKIEKLKLEYGAEKKIQRRLLERLVIPVKKPKSIDAKLNKISKSTSRKHFHLMYTGHVKKLIETLQAKSATRKDILNQIDMQMNKLSRRRLETYYFFAQARRSTLESTLHAFSLLKKFLSHQGNLVKDFEKAHPCEFDILVKFDKSFLTKIHKMIKDSEILVDEKKIIGARHKTPALPDDQQRDFILEQQGLLLTARINQLQAPAWWKSSTKNKKVQLLVALNNNLKVMSLEDSLNAIHRHPELGPDYYLLHEGKTGKMVKQFSQLHTSREDMIKKITVEIARLKEKRMVDYYFSAQSKKLLVEDRIQACIELQKKLSTMELVPAFKSLKEAERKILLHYEPKLLDELNQWDILQSQKLTSIKVINSHKP